MHRLKTFRLFKQQQRSFADASQLKKTALYDFHVSNGGKMVEFGGWSMPVQYKDSISASTVHTRQNASIFDVSHMGQLKFYGKDRINFLESIVISSISPLKENQIKYTLMTNEKGGVVDDLVIANRSNDHNYHYMVINAGRVNEDLNHISQQLSLQKSNNNSFDCNFEYLTDYSLIAFQGPKAVNVMSRLNPSFDFNSLSFFHLCDMNINNIPLQVSRSGYTGEDGFEIAVPNDNVVEFVEILLNEPESKLAGLGARDSLRLEAGLCLYGHDLTEDISPIEADLLWTMSKKRRKNGQFIGSDIIKDQIKNGIKRKRVGLLCQKGLAPRAHMNIKDSNDNVIGEVTSGGQSPCLQLPIAMGYVSTEFADIDTPLKVAIRANKDIDVKVCKVPFVEKGYFRAD